MQNDMAVQILSELKSMKEAQARTDEKIEQVAQETREIRADVTRLAQETLEKQQVIVESYFGPKFNLLADELSLMREEMTKRDKTEQLEERIRFLESRLEDLARKIG